MKKGFYFTGCILASIVFLFWVGFRIYNNIQFDRKCEGYLKRAADANTIELAKAQLTKAITYLEDNNMTSGYTSIVYTTPDEDVAFWYTNLKSSLKELNSINDSTTQLEKTNVLMKLRETLLDSGDEGSSKVTSPAGISIFPDNVAYMLWGIISLIIAVLCGIGAGVFWYD